MKLTSKILLFLLLAALPINLFAQNPTIIVAYMKVAHEQTAQYLEVEQAWKKVHTQAIEMGVHKGWQLWRNVHAGANDPYQYITIQWYNNHAHALGENAPQGWMEELYSDEEWDEMVKKTLASRTYAFEDVAHQVTTVDNPGSIKYLIVSRMRTKPGMTAEYEKMEKEIFKPYFEELIRRGGMEHWGIYNIWPYDEGQPTYSAIQGYKDAKQFSEPSVSVDPSELNLDITIEEVMELVQKTREIVSTEIWELVDSVFPEQ